MSLLSFEMKKIIATKWLYLLISFVLFLSLIFFLWKSVEVEPLIPTKIAEIQKEYEQLAIAERNFKASDEKAYEALKVQRPQLFQTVYQELEEAEAGLLAKDSQRFVDAWLNYYKERSSVYDVLYQQDRQPTRKEQQEIYYLQTLQSNKQVYEDRNHSLFTPNFLYQLALIVSQPIVYVFLLFLCFLPFGREKEEGTILFMLGMSKRREFYFISSQILLFFCYLGALALLITSSYFISQFRGHGLMGGNGFSGNWVVDASFLLKSVTTYTQALFVFWVLCLPLGYFFLQLYYFMMVKISASLAANFSFLLVSLGIGFGLKDLWIIGNPFRFFNLQELLFHQPDMLDLSLSVVVAFLLGSGLFFLIVRSRDLSRRVKK